MNSSNYGVAKTYAQHSLMYEKSYELLKLWSSKDGIGTAEITKVCLMNSSNYGVAKTNKKMQNQGTLSYELLKLWSSKD